MAFWEDGMTDYLNLAVRAINVMQSTWWNGSSSWNGINAWQRPAIADTLITYTLLSDDYSYTDVIESAVRNTSGLSGNDDILWSAIAALKAYYLTGDLYYWNNMVIPDYNSVKSAWTTACGGGLLWDNKKDYKNAITNELWIYFLTLMYQATKDSGLLQKAIDAYTWFVGSGMINGHSLINDGIKPPPECGNNGKTTYTYNQGVIVGGLLNLQLVTDPNSTQPYADLANSITQAVVNSNHLVSDGGILQEPNNQDLDANQVYFKGVFMTQFGHFIGSSQGRLAADFVTQNADYVNQNELTGEGEINAYWSGNPEAAGAILGAAPQGSGINLFLSAYQATNTPTNLWSYVNKISGVGTSNNPSSCSYAQRLYSAWKGSTDDHIWFASMSEEGVWGDQNYIQGAGTSTSPSLASFNSLLYAAWKGSGDNYIWYASTDDSDSWSSGQASIPNVTVDTSPALAHFNGRLYVIWKGVGNDESIYFASMGTDGTWSTAGSSASPPTIPNTGTSTSPSLAAFNGWLYAAWKGSGSDQKIYYASMDTGENWSPQQQPAKSDPYPSTDSSPSLAAFGDEKLYLAWKGVGSDDHIWFSDSSDGETWSPQTKFVLPGLTTRSPALAYFNNCLYNVYSGSPNASDADNILYSYGIYSGNRGF